jgi:hypothetical protein
MTNADKVYKVKVRYQRDSGNMGEYEISAYDKVTLVSPWTGMELTIAGFFDGDACEDIRHRAAVATGLGALGEQEIELTKAELYRWRDAHAEMIRHYCD